MFNNPFAYVMVGTFAAAVITLVVGVSGIGRGTSAGEASRSTKLMMLRVALCALLLAEIIIYEAFLKS
ncbi:MAG: hypothetical protein GC129_05460 [Proteobacteria bacterium]|nr:hypothetical protein [Pseudomonadota bacterium]